MNRLRSIFMAGVLLCGMVGSEAQALHREQDEFSLTKTGVAAGVGITTGSLAFLALTKIAGSAKNGGPLNAVVGAGLAVSALSYLAAHREDTVDKLVGKKYTPLSYTAALATFGLWYVTYPMA